MEYDLQLTVLGIEAESPEAAVAYLKTMIDSGATLYVDVMDAEDDFLIDELPLTPVI